MRKHCHNCNKITRHKYKYIGREDSNDSSALQEYASMVMQIPGADLGSIEEILDA